MLWIVYFSGVFIFISFEKNCSIFFIIAMYATALPGDPFEENRKTIDQSGIWTHALSDQSLNLAP